MAAKPFESRIQDLVYNVEVGVGLVIIKYFLYLIFIFLLAFLYVAGQFQGYKEADAMEYAQLAREYAETGKLRTNVIRPATLWYLLENGIKVGPSGKSDLMLDHPDILHPPVYPVLMGWLLKAGNARLDAVEIQNSGRYGLEQWFVVFNVLCVMITGLFVFLSGRRLFDRQVALIAVTLFFLSKVVWDQAITGLPASLAMLLGTVSLHFILVAAGNRQEQKPALRWLFPLLISLLASILLFHTLYAGAVVVFAAVLLVGFSMGRLRWLVALVYLMLFLAAMLPWMQRNQRLSGGPFGFAPYTIFHETGSLAKQSLDRNLYLNFEELNTGGKLVKSVFGKFNNYFPRNLDRVTRELGSGLLAAVFLVSLFHRFNRPGVQVLRWAVFAGLLGVAVVGSLWTPSGMRVAPVFWPVVVLYATAYFYILRERLNLSTNFFNGALTTLFVAYNALPLILAMKSKATQPYPPYYPPFIKHISSFAEPNDLLCSDMPWGTAWYGKRATVLMPVNVDQFYDINDFTKRVAAIYFTPISRNQAFISELQAGGEASWFNVQTGNVPGDFPLREGFLLGGKDHVFLTDAQRVQKDKERRTGIR